LQLFGNFRQSSDTDCFLIANSRDVPIGCMSCRYFGTVYKKGKPILGLSRNDHLFCRDAHNGLIGLPCIKIVSSQKQSTCINQWRIQARASGLQPPPPAWPKDTFTSWTGKYFCQFQTLLAVVNSLIKTFIAVIQLLISCLGA
jgi:hypothetical protein